MDAVVTAGGRPKPGEYLYEYTQGNYKALLDIAGKPMIQWVLDALSGSKNVERVIVIGLSPESGITCTKPLTFLPDQGSMLDNIRAGTRKALEENPSVGHVLLVSSDIPGITSEMVDWEVNTCKEMDDDFDYIVVTKESMEARYPGSRRSFYKLRGAELTGGDMNVIRAELVNRKEALWTKIIDARKSLFKQASLIGFDTLFLLAFRLINVEQAASLASKRLKIKAHAVVSPYAEIGMDVDKPHQLELMRADLSRRQTSLASEKA